MKFSLGVRGSVFTVWILLFLFNGIIRFIIFFRRFLKSFKIRNLIGFLVKCYRVFIFVFGYSVNFIGFFFCGIVLFGL